MKKTENYTKTKETEKDANNCKELETNVFGITDDEYEKAEIIEKEEGE